MRARGLLLLMCATVAACGGGTVRSGEPAATAAGLTDGNGSGGVESDIERIREATSAFRSLDAAVAAGYAANVQQCIDNPPQGAMGFHHVNRALLDDVLEVDRPEMLVYERTADGEYVLNGVEYIVPYTSRSRDAEPPTILGQQLKRADGLQLWYLHVWTWKENPSGVFADWNPAVECRT